MEKGRSLLYMEIILSMEPSWPWQRGQDEMVDVKALTQIQKQFYWSSFFDQQFF
jgi:hypothetical protein